MQQLAPSRLPRRAGAAAPTGDPDWSEESAAGPELALAAAGMELLLQRRAGARRRAGSQGFSSGSMGSLGWARGAGAVGGPWALRDP